MASKLSTSRRSVIGLTSQEPSEISSFLVVKKEGLTPRDSRKAFKRSRDHDSIPTKKVSLITLSTASVALDNKGEADLDALLLHCSTSWWNLSVCFWAMRASSSLLFLRDWSTLIWWFFNHLYNWLADQVLNTSALILPALSKRDFAVRSKLSRIESRSS
ncbi:hypothetical protein WICPIJ_002122 [Wickerhamomyces pijperi]|uniref:Uncharacterized protein n=1 Tax=Wickerhamomyces pijperi TaxID=599730 RepID=A0A9P8QAE5_WICPI|nr:hypothetical protein WICPIJ_002122 [Wickerhamomyces pijperi]